MYDERFRIKFGLSVFAVAIVVVACFFYLRLDAIAIFTVAPAFLSFIATEFMPPALDNASAFLLPALFTVAFAVVSTLISAFFSFIFALMMTEAIMPYWTVRFSVRFVMTFVRNIPVVIWAVMMVLIFGVGSMVGLMALIMATTGFLSRSYAESINEIAVRKLEPMRASGVGKLAMIRHGLLPEFAPAWVNWTLFSFELNVRASAVLGLVGVGIGMGLTIQTRLTFRRFQDVATMVLILIIVVLATEFIANWMRNRFMNNVNAASSAAPPKNNVLRVVPLHALIKKWFAIVVIVSVFVLCIFYIDLDVARFVGRLNRAPDILRQLMRIDIGIITTGLRQFSISFAMGLVGLVLGGLLAFMLAFLAADNIAPFKPLAMAIKGFVSIVRAVPSLIFILMIVAAVGLGYTAGVVVLILSSMGYLTKAFVGTIEEQHRGIITAMRATGAGWWQIVLHGLLPAVLTGFFAWLAIRMETSVAESVTLGVVGAGGIGTLISRAERNRDFAALTTLILIIVICMAALEWGSNYLRRRVVARG